MAVSLPSGITPWVWYDAADSSTVSTSGTSVTGWMNKGFSAGGSGSVGGTAGAVKYGTQTINGLPVVSSELGGFYRTPAITATSQSFSYFTVYTPRVAQTTASTNYLFFTTVGAANQGGPVIANNFYTSDGINRIHVGNQGVAWRTIANYTHIINSPALLSVQLSSTAANNFTAINGTNLTLTTSAASSGVPTSGSATYDMNWSQANDFGEVILYMGDLTTAQKQQIEGYLAWKWGLQAQLPAAHPYSVATFTHNLSQRPLPKPWVWFDAADSTTITASGSSLTAIANKGSAGGTASVGAGSATTGSATINSRNAIAIAAGGKLTTSSLIPTNQAFAVIGVVQTGAIGSNTLSLVDGGASGIRVDLSGTTFWTGIGTTERVSASFGPGFSNIVGLYSADNSAVSTTSNVLAVDGQFITPASNTLASGMSLTSTAYDIVRVAAGSAATSLAEIMIFMGEISVEQRQLVEGYLAWKWGLQGSLPVSHPFFAIPYVNREQQIYSLPNGLTPWSWIDAADRSTVITDSANNVLSVLNKGSVGTAVAPSGTVTSSSAQQLNGVNLITTGNTSANLTLNANAAIYGQSIFVVFKNIQGSQGGQNKQIFFFNGGGSQPQVGISVEGNLEYGVNTVGYPLRTSSAAYVFAAGSNSILGINVGGGSNAFNAITLNGTSEALSSSTTYTATINRTWNLASSTGSFAASSTLGVAEHMIFNQPLTTIQRQQVEGYLAWKWGLVSQLPAGHPYKSSFIGTPIMTHPMIWYDAADASTITASGTTLNGWSNKGSDGSGSGTRSGTIATGTTTINGKNAVAFAANSTLGVPVITPTTQAFSAFAVTRTNTDIADTVNMRLMSSSNTSGAPQLTVSRNVSTYSLNGSSRLQGLKTTGTISNPYLTTSIYSAVVSASSTSNNIATLDGSSLTLTANVVMSGGTTSAITDYIIEPTAAAIDIAELLMFQGELTTAQRQQIEGYLAAKWGLANQLPSTHPYYPIARNTWSLADSWVSGNISIPGCRLWLDAAHTNFVGLAETSTTISNTALWYDKMVLTNATVSGGPIVRVRDLNGLNTVGLRGASDYFSVANNFTDPGYTVIGLFRIMTAHTGSFGILSTTTSGLNGRGLGVNAGKFAIDSNNTMVDTGITFAVGTWYIATLVFDMTTTCRYRINGTAYTATIGNAANDNTNGFKVGLWHTADTNNTNMDIAETLCFNRVLSSSEIDRLEGYLGWKWGIQTSLPSTHLLANIATAPLSAPQNVAAIAGPTGALISWIPPTSDGGSPITGYRVIASNGAFVDVDSEARAARITGLTTGVSYTFSVAAKNVAGFGPTSAATSTVIPSLNVAPVYNGGSYFLTGATNSGITIPNTADLRFGTGDFTIEFWQYWIPFSGTANWSWSRVFTFGRTLDTSLSFSFNSTEGPLFSTTVNTLVAKNPVNTNDFFNKWKHIAITRKDGFIRLFVDGIVVASRTDTYNFTDSTRNLNIGNDTDNYSFRGFISQFHYVAGTALYTANFTPPTSEIQPVANSKILLLAKSSGTLTTDYSPVARTGITTTNVTWSPASPYASLAMMPYQRRIVSTFAGSGSAALTDGTGTGAAFYSPLGLHTDASDNIYVADYINNKIRMITPAGVVSTLPGTVPTPQGVVRDSQGNIFATSWDTHQIWRLSAGGTSFVSFAGSTAGTAGYQDGTGSDARFNNLLRMAIDASDNIYVADHSNHKVRRITPAGVVTTYAGPTSGTASGAADGAANSATFNQPSSCVFDSQGNLFVSELSNHKIRRITPTGVVSTFAGAPAGSSTSGDVDGVGISARCNGPDCLTIDKYDNLYVFDRVSRKVRKITPDGVVSTVIGPPMGSSTSALINGIDQAARFTTISQGMALDSANNLFITVQNTENRIRRAAIGSRWQVATLAGLSGTPGTAVGDVAAVRFINPIGCAIGKDGSLYICDTANNRVIKITPDGNCVVLAGAAGSPGGADGVGASATFLGPVYVCLDKNENLFVADFDGHRIRKITPSGHVTTIAGTGTAGYVDGHGSIAQFNKAHGICIDVSENLYVVDYLNNRIRKLTPGVDGYTVSTYAGTGSNSSVNASTAISAAFAGPIAITVDTSGNVYVVELGTTNVRKISPNGGAVTSFSTSATAIRGIQYNIYDGFLYLGGRTRITRIATDGTNGSTVAGTTTAGEADGIGSAAGFDYPMDTAFDSYGNIYIPDYHKHTIRLLKYAVAPDAPTLSLSDLTISWSAPANNGLPITGYDVLNSYGTRIATLSASILTYTVPSDGTYRVRAINDAGTSTATAITVSSANVPGAPTGVSAVAGALQVSLSWTAPNDGGATITAYRVYDQSGNQIGFDVNGLSTTITGLTAGQTYSFTVRAVNSVGQSAASTASNSVLVFTTPGVPQNVAATDGSGQIVLSWSAPALDGSSNILSYRITDQSGNTTDVSANVFTRTFTGLTAGFTYSYTVAAQNAAGYGTASSAASRLVFGKPGIPQNVSATDGSGQVVLNWSAPALDGSSNITGYRITDQSGNTTDVSANVFTRTFTGLTAGFTYNYTVAAQNAAGYGSASAAASLLVFGKPGAPTIITVAGGDKSAVLVWSAAAANSSTITKYTITVSPGSATVDVSGSETTGTITGLTNGVSYTFTVAATNAAGLGPASASSPAVVPNAPPTGPFYLVDLNGSPSYVVGDVVATNLFTSPTDISDTDGIPANAFTYKWQIADVSSDASFADISGATEPTITLLTAYVGKYIRAIVFYTDNAGIAETVKAPAVGPIATTVPYAPTGLTAVGADMSATVSWTAPNDGGLAITKYTVVADPATDPVEVSGNLTSAVVGGLQVNTEYTFTVYATNANGDGASSSPSTAISTTDYPAALTFSAADASNGSVILSWAESTDGGSTITSYTIYNVTDEVQYTDISSGQRSYTVSGLTNGVEYTFAISATNANGEGPASGGLIYATPFTTPDAPAGVLALSLNTGDIRVSWNAPDDNGRPVLDYRITDGSGQTTVVPSSPWTFSGLTLGRTYSYTVAARNIAGYSAESDQVSALSRTTPTAPQNVQADADISSVILSWSAPVDNGGSAITAYRVYNAAGSQVGSDVSGLSTTVSGLTNGVSYTFYIRAVNIAGESENSAGATATPRRAPDAPTIVSVAYGNALIDLSWNAPAFDGGSPTLDYRVYYNGLTKDVSDTSTRLTDLSNGTLYTIQVAARNVVGYGTLSDTFTATPSTVPDAPTMGTPVAASRRITVNWGAPASNGGAAISSYELYFDGSSEPIATGIIGTSYTVINLTNDVEYQFRVVAVNMNGSSSLSAASAAIAPFNSPPTGDVDISGLIVEGASIQMVDTLSDADGLGPLQYKWFRSEVDQAMPGFNWTIRASPADRSWSSVAYGRDISNSPMWVAVATTASGTTNPSGLNRLMTSSDGINWTQRTPAADINWNCVAYGEDGSGNPLWVAVASGGTRNRIMTSSNGINWTSRDNIIDRSWRSVAYGRDGSGNRLWCATNSTANEVLISSDGYTWSLLSNTLGGLCIEYGNGRWVIGGGGKLITSTNGTTWSSQITPPTTQLLNGLAYGAGRWVAVGNAGAIITSTNGTSWTLCTSPTTFNFNEVRYADGLWIAVGSDASLNGCVITSHNGIDWTLQASPTTRQWQTLAYGEGLWVAIAGQAPGGAAGNRIMTSGTFGTNTIRDGSYNEIANQITSSYTSNATDTGRYIKGMIYYTDEAGTNELAYSDSYGVIASFAPINLSVIPGAAYVDLSWNVPTFNGKTITGYRVRHHLSSVDASGAASQIVQDLSASIGGLTNGSEYTFRVAAGYDGTYGSESLITETPYTVPDAPATISAVAANASIRVSWTAPDFNGGRAVSGYDVSCNGQTVSLGATDLSYNITGLTNGQSYTIEVRARNIAGAGAAASTSEIPYTTPDAPTITSVVAGNEEVSISWSAPAFDGGREITGYRVYYGYDSVDVSGISRTIGGLMNALQQSFYVVAINAAGEGTPSTTVYETPYTVPDAPTDLSATAGVRSVSLNWTAPAGNGRVVDYYRVSESRGTTYDVSDGSTSLVISDLSNGTTYTYTVAAHNLAGFSLSSSSASATPRTVPNVPVGLTATPGDTYVDLNWTPPYDGGASITQYRIVYGDISGTTTSTSFRASGLTNGTTYVFYVYAINEAGSSLAQTVNGTPRTVPGTPTAPIATPANGSITVYWDIPSSNGGSAITGYRVAYGAISVDLSASTLEYTASSLTNGQSYTFDIYAVNAAGESATPLSITSTPRTTPDAVQNLTAAHKNGAVDLSWNTPAFDGGAAIQYYRVSYDGTYVDVSGSTSTTISGLTNGTEYTFSVAAYNVAGYGSASTISATPSTIPGKPTFGFNLGANNSVLLNWSVDNGGAEITGSRVYYVPAAGGSTSHVDVSGSATSTTVSGLTNGTYYLFTVEATNLNGTGATSDQSSPVAPYSAPDSPAITLVESRDGFMRIEWSHSGATGGFALSKFVIYDGSGSIITDSIDPSQRTVDISANLVIGTSYAFKMKAFTAGSYGEVASSAFSSSSSAVILGTRPDAPIITDLSSGDATIRVSWSAPIYTGYYAITKYTVYSAAGSVLADNISPSASYVDISASNGVPIAVKMTATNQIGTSDFSASTAEVIPSRVPDAPTDLTATHGDRQISLSWTAPVNDGSANIIKYGVYYADGTAIDENIVGTTFTVSDLSNGQLYTFKVAAFNLRGRGAFSQSASETPSRVPDAPPEPTATAGNRSAVVYWDAPAANGAAISLYEVYDGSGVKWADTSSTLVDISGLTNGRYYQFRVRAQNRNGFGSYSTLSDPVLPNADVSGSVDISGIFMEGQSIEAVLNLSDEDGLPTLFNYQWQVASASVGPYTDISGQISASFAITSTYVRKYLRVYVSYTDLAGISEEIYSGFVGPINDVPSGLDISGAAVEGQTLSADFTNFVDEDGYDVANFNYQWSDSSGGVLFTAISGATASSFLLTQAQVDKYVRLVVSYTDNTGMPHIISATIGPVENINNAPVGQPLITGTVAVGQTVYTDFTPVSDLDGIDMNSLTYQWQIADAADGFFEDVCGETQVSFEIQRSEVNQFLRVKVDYIDLYGASEEVISVVATGVPPTVPDAPTGLAATHGDTYVDLSWNAPAWTGGVDLSGYIIYSVDGATTTEVVRTPAGDISERISGLTNGTLYVFQVSAYNVAGEGSTSASASETPSRPASVPQDVSGLHGDEQVSIYWNAPASNGGATITGYKVFNGSTEVASVGEAIRAVDISGLTNGISYTFSVYAVNRNGLGDGANVIITPSRAPDAPASISAQHGDQQITINWTAPTIDGGAEILGYFVYGSGLATQDISNGTTAVFTGLTNGTTYSFFVRAYNLNGPGSSTETIQEKPNTTPSAPRDVSGTPGNALVVLTWLAPLSDGGDAIQGYRIYEGSTLRGTAGPNELSGTATGLTNGVPATLVVRAFNRSGDGAASASITITPNGFASPPLNLSALSGNESVLLSWAAPLYDGGTGIIEYVVKTYSGDTLVSTTTFGGLSGEVVGLTNGTTYTFRVYGRTQAGLGEEASITSKPYTVPGPVRSLAAERGNGQLALSWVAPVSDGGDSITSYRIVRDGTTIVDTGNTTTSRTITGLANGQLYTFTVQAQNARGFGTAVDVSGTPSRAPDAITDASGSYGDRTATIYWSAPNDGGSPILQYRVYLNGVSIETVQPNIRFYTFENLTNGTTYTMNVRAENHTAAPLSNTVSQTPRTTPSAPTNIMVDPSRNLVRVSWTVPDNGGATITRFEVGDVSAGNAVVATVLSATATFVDVSGLTNGQAYRFVVRAVNSEGPGPWSSISTLVYPGDVPSKPTITSVSYENEAITVFWSAPTDLGGFTVDTYRIVYTGAATPVDVSGDLLTKKITGLTNGTLYQFTVYAINEKGIGSPSDISTAIKPSRFPDAPAKPVVTGHGDGSISIQWSAPNDRGDAIQGYRVYISGSDTVRANPLAGTTTATITGLTNGTNYQFRVHAYNRDGPSPLSDASDPEFPSRVPDPAIVNPPTHGNGEISLSWSEPYDGGAPIIYYRIYRQVVGTNIWALIETTANGSVLSTTVRGIDNGTAYVFRVDTINRDGTTMSAPSAQVVPSTTPGVPRSGQKQHLDGSANLSWDAPEWNGGNAIIGYRVFDISADETTATPLADVSGLSATIGGLTNGTTYIFKVLAYNINGQGPALQLPAVVPSRLPDTVVAATAKSGDQSVLIRWTAPFNGGAAITSYRVYDDQNNVLRDVSNTDTLTALFTGLTNGQTYTYRIKARNLNGFSTNFSNDISGTPFVVNLTTDLPPKQQETIITTSITKTDETTGQITTETVPLVATTVENNKDTGVVSIVTSDPKLSNVMIANVPTSGVNTIDEVVIAVAPKTAEFGIIIAVKAFQNVQNNETTTRTSISDFTENPLSIILTLPGETTPSVDVFTRQDSSEEFRYEGKATLVSAAAHTYRITVRHLTEFAFKIIKLVPCFPMGTRVLTAAGYKAIEKLAKEDRLVTSEGRVVPFARAHTLVDKTTTSNAPYLIPAHTFGRNQPAAPITLSPHHAFQSRKGIWQIPQHAAATHSQIKQIDVGRAVLYFHLKLPNYLRDNVVVEGGVVAESYGGPEYGSVDTIYKYSSRLGGYTRRSDNMQVSKR